ncbi:actin nucleation-promoting factor WAS-like [Grus americana]|uniref:actin nucleation-promoting factor WAS-like n=1 Tax=Grus americana TaxID=9117 RepID=UPI0024077BC1|nr:actin nucleation-promoting factor WAS-like [Grus americana]
MPHSRWRPGSPTLPDLLLRTTPAARALAPFRPVTSLPAFRTVMAGGGGGRRRSTGETPGAVRRSSGRLVASAPRGGPPWPPLPRRNQRSPVPPPRLLLTPPRPKRGEGEGRPQRSPPPPAEKRPLTSVWGSRLGELEAWAARMNAQFEEAERFRLVVE